MSFHTTTSPLQIIENQTEKEGFSEKALSYAADGAYSVCIVQCFVVVSMVILMKEFDLSF
jgi:hypothetical protein